MTPKDEPPCGLEFQRNVCHVASYENEPQITKSPFGRFRFTHPFQVALQHNPVGFPTVIMELHQNEMCCLLWVGGWEEGQLGGLGRVRFP